MWKFIFSIPLIVISLALAGQEENGLTLKKKEPVSFKPHELKIGVNAIRSGRAFFSSGFISHELEAALGIHRYYVVFNYGIEEQKKGDSFDYQNKGSYFRVGMDKNFFKNKASGNVLSLGVRYAQANFNDQLIHTADKGFGMQTYKLQNENIIARWAEVVVGLRGKIISNFYMGITLRWQLARKIDGEGDLKILDIPGFGNTKNTNSTAFDYYLMWRIPFKGKSKQ